MMFGGALSNQLGAATGALAFGVIGPAGVVAVRQWIAGIVLLAAGRPRWRSFTRAQWRPVLLLAVAYGTMNLSLYSAIGRLGLGLAVTLEFLGPLAVALATSRRRADHPERQRPGRCAQLVGQGAAEHQGRPRPRVGPRPHGVVSGRPGTGGLPRVAAGLDFACRRHTARVRRAYSCVKCIISLIYTDWL